MFQRSIKEIAARIRRVNASGMCHPDELCFLRRLFYIIEDSVNLINLNALLRIELVSSNTSHK